jgi:hypothetical protein
VPSYHFYGDESGNSGGGFLDPEQPIFVLSLVGWPADREAEVLKEYENICILHGRTPSHQLQPQAGPIPKEHKAEKLLERPSGRQFCISLMDMVPRLGLSCVFGVSEKRFLLAAMFVETFLDPYYNKLAPPQDNVRLRQKIAREIYNLSDDPLLKSFLSAARNNDSHALEQIGTQLAGRLRLHTDPEVSKISQAIEHGASRAFRFGEEQVGAPRRANRPHPGIHTLFATIFTLEQRFVRIESDAQVVLDEEGAWDIVKQYAFELQTNSDAFLDEIGLSSLKKVRLRSFANSQSHFGLQLADILAGALMRGCRSWYVGKRDFVDEPVYDKAGNLFRLFENESFVAVKEQANVLDWAKNSKR